MISSLFHEARFEDVAAALQRALLLVRLAGRLPAPVADRAAGEPWTAWLESEEAVREAGELTAAHELAREFCFDRLEDLCARATAPSDDVVDSEALLSWLLSARHARPLLRWARRALDSARPVPATGVLAAGLAAFHYPPGEAVAAWCFLRWRRGWQSELRPDARQFLLLSGPALPALRRRVLPQGTPVAAAAR